MAETSVPDPDGEDFCAFGTKLTCRPFLWQDGHMSALPTLGGNNGSASDINNRGQIAGTAETTVSDSGCPANVPMHTILPVIWEEGKAHPLPTLGGDPDGVAFAINDRGQVVGESGICAGAIHAILWENGTAFSLPDVGGGALAQGINNQGQVVGSTLDSGFNWSHGFIYQDGVMTDLKTLYPASSNLFATMANKINERGQISGMATVLSGPHAGDIHAFLATPVDVSVGTSIADVAPAYPKSVLSGTNSQGLWLMFGGPFRQ